MAQQIESKAPITDAAIDQVIKANEAIDENSEITQGGQLRKLVKDLRDRLETEITINSENLGNKVDKEEGKGLSTLDFTQADKESIENFNNWSDDAASKDYVDGKVIPLQTSIDDLKDNMNGVVRLLDAPLSSIYLYGSAQLGPGIENPQWVYSPWFYIDLPDSSSDIVYELEVPKEFFTGQVKGYIKIDAILRTNLMSDDRENSGFKLNLALVDNTEQFIPILESSFDSRTTSANTTQINKFQVMMVSEGQGNFYCYSGSDKLNISRINISLGGKIKFHFEQSYNKVSSTIEALTIDHSFFKVN